MGLMAITVLIALNAGMSGCSVFKKRTEIPPSATQKKNRFDDTTQQVWPDDFKVVEIPSSLDGKLQKAYFRKSGFNKPMPLIVSLHTWGGTYAQRDALAPKVKQNEWNYIHPDFRGANRSCEACCSELALADIDDAIDFAISNSKVDLSRIYVIGASGGGYATLSFFMKSKHRINSFYAWVPLCDLIINYQESIERKNRYFNDIILCTCSTDGKLNEKVARDKSPLYWPTPVEKLRKSKLRIYPGVTDGVTGPVPITHSINFYNKVLKDLGVRESKYYVSDDETKFLLENRKPFADFGEICGRDICLMKEYGNISVTIFQGGHEMLGCALDIIMND